MTSVLNFWLQLTNLAGERGDIGLLGLCCAVGGVVGGGGCGAAGRSGAWPVIRARGWGGQSVGGVRQADRPIRQFRILLRQLQSPAAIYHKLVLMILKSKCNRYQNEGEMEGL